MQYAKENNLTTICVTYHLWDEKVKINGVEVHGNTLSYCKTEEEIELALRPFRIAKKCGCKFYLGSDAHRPHEFEGAKEKIERLIDLLVLTEDDKSRI